MLPAAEIVMESERITLSISKELLRKVRLLAARRQTTVAALLTEALEELVREEVDYARSKFRHFRLLERGFDLGTGGQIKTTRDELHDRH